MWRFFEQTNDLIKKKKVKKFDSLFRLNFGFGRNKKFKFSNTKMQLRANQKSNNSYSNSSNTTAVWIFKIGFLFKNKKIGRNDLTKTCV